MSHDDYESTFKNSDSWIDHSVPHILTVSVVVGRGKFIEIDAGNLFRISDNIAPTDLI